MYSYRQFAVENTEVSNGTTVSTATEIEAHDVELP